MSTIKGRQKDPRHLPVQLNVSVPWSLREFLIDQAKTEGLSLNKLMTRVIMAEFGTAYRKQEEPFAKEKIREAGWDVV